MSRLSATLALESGQVTCRHCHTALGPHDQPWKRRAALKEIPIESGATPGPSQLRIVLRQFSCRTCGALLDVETALCDDPFLDDRVTP